ncbi:glycoside hydrolase family 127 protein [Trichococcus alkaliphilus]|uniref:glycoside hydrolase family 127 protein n=1 Tax=Trichococcus alkaliphilus TaxID=2052943 RepID=UPI000D0B4EC8|nr:beta-L-arabinofuranosidase domain-containing protein [Trichococcus alkaliphilus]
MIKPSLQQNPKVTVADSFWLKYMQLVKEEMIPFQWDVLNDRGNIVIESERDDATIPTEKSHVIENFKIAAGLKEGHHYGWLFQDSDLYKWIEAAANTLALEKDDALVAQVEETIDLLEAAQADDGYLSTYYQIDAPQLKFRRLFESHELYCIGHLIEAAIAYHEATGSDRLLQIADKAIACIETHFGKAEGKIDGTDGHQEIELALVRLYELTGNRKYLDLSAYFLEVRGQNPQFFAEQLEENDRLGLQQGPKPGINAVYHQADIPVIEQDTARGHAVRLVYMAQAMAGTGHYQENEKLVAAAKKIWDNIVQKRMYVTGGIGSTVRGEAFTYDYDLPNDLMYCETCAAIGLLNFSNELLRAETDSRYSDIMERVLYNGIISGMALDGKHFFYVNPLEVDPQASALNPDKSHVKATRPSWFGCACCPPNLARTLPAVGRYAFTQKDDEVLLNLFIDSELVGEQGGKAYTIRQSHTFSEDGRTLITVGKASAELLRLGIRIPYWAEHPVLVVDGEETIADIRNGYTYVTVKSESTAIELTYTIATNELEAHPLVKADKGKVALQRGPFIYCLEEQDNGKQLHLLALTGAIRPRFRSDKILGDIVCLEGEGELQMMEDGWQDTLYRVHQKPQTISKKLMFIPYYSWGNRSLGEMQVWIDKEDAYV